MNMTREHITAELHGGPSDGVVLEVDVPAGALLTEIRVPDTPPENLFYADRSGVDSGFDLPPRTSSVYRLVRRVDGRNIYVHEHLKL
jgi:hypothetical protein